MSIKIYYKVEAPSIRPVILDKNRLCDYLSSVLEGRIVNGEYIKITPVEMEESDFLGDKKNKRDMPSIMEKLDRLEERVAKLEKSNSIVTYKV